MKNSKKAFSTDDMIDSRRKKAKKKMKKMIEAPADLPEDQINFDTQESDQLQ